MDTTLFKLALAFLCVATLIPGISSIICGKKEFKCPENEICFPKSDLCNGFPDCDDSFDENYCEDGTANPIICPSNWWKCKRFRKCIPSYWRCDGDVDCRDNSDESNCMYVQEMRRLSARNKTHALAAKRKLTTWFLRRLKDNEKRREVYRTTIALHLADNRYFAPGNKAGEEVASIVKRNLLTSLTSGNLNQKELAFGIHSLMVTCSNPRNFYGFDLVSQFRALVREDKTHPLDLLALCNADAAMTPDDVQRAADAFDSKNRSFTLDNQALALQALACIQSRINFTLEGTNTTVMAQELKRHQFENGTVGSLRTTALVLQALISSQSYQEDFNLDAAMKIILDGQKEDGSFGSLVDSYYIMPLLTKKSFMSISSSHCQLSTNNELGTSGVTSTVRVYYLIWVNDDQKTRHLYVPSGSSFYDVIEIVNVLDTNQKVQYHVVEGKPYVSSVGELQEDLEMGRRWYTYMQPKRKELRLIEKSPVDVKIQYYDHLLLWYK